MLHIEPTRDHPIPFDLSDERPATQTDSVAVAVNTIDFIEGIGGSIDFNAEDAKAAVDFVTRPVNSPRHLTNPAQAKAAHIILKEHDYQSFEYVQQARNFITNRLIELAACGDPKLEIKALELLGKHSDVGLFTNRSEITIHHKSPETLENSIKERVKRLLNAPTEIEDLTPLDDLDAHLGAIETGTFETSTEESDEPNA